MTEARSIETELETWDRGAWCLAALVLAARADNSSTDLALAAGSLLDVLGLDLPPDSATRSLDQLASQAAAPLHLAAALVTSQEAGWAVTSDDALLSQGRASARGAAMFASIAVPAMADLGARLATPGCRMLDVGTGVAAMAVGFAEAFPQLHVLGIDVFDRALELAQRTIAASLVADRVSVRKQDVALFSDDQGFDLAWVPAPFIATTILPTGLVRVVSTIRDGGWLIIGHGKFGTDPISDALNRLKTIAFGGTPLDDPTAQRLLRRAGLTNVSTLPSPPGAPALTVGQRRTSNAGAFAE